MQLLALPVGRQVGVFIVDKRVRVRNEENNGILCSILWRKGLFFGSGAESQVCFFTNLCRTLLLTGNRVRNISQGFHDVILSRLQWKLW